jgi:hypothetical protein
MVTPLARLRRLEDRFRGQQCRHCWDTGSGLVFVPDGANPDAPEFNPTACPRCGRPYDVLRQIVGISEAEFVGDGNTP